MKYKIIIAIATGVLACATIVLAYAHNNQPTTQARHYQPQQSHITADKFIKQPITALHKIVEQKQEEKRKLEEAKKAEEEAKKQEEEKKAEEEAKKQEAKALEEAKQAEEARQQQAQQSNEKAAQESTQKQATQEQSQPAPQPVDQQATSYPNGTITYNGQTQYIGSFCNYWGSDASNCFQSVVDNMEIMQSYNYLSTTDGKGTWLAAHSSGPFAMFYNANASYGTIIHIQDFNGNGRDYKVDHVLDWTRSPSGDWPAGSDTFFSAMESEESIWIQFCLSPPTAYMPTRFMLARPIN